MALAAVYKGLHRLHFVQSYGQQVGLQVLNLFLATPYIRSSGRQHVFSLCKE